MSDNTDIPSFSNDDFTFDEVIHGDRLEVSYLTDIDIGVTNKIGAVIGRLHVSSPEHARNKRLAAFATRSTKDKLAMGEFESPRRFLMALSKQRATPEPGETETKQKNVQLPYLYVTRAPGIVFAEPDQYADVSDMTELCDPDGAYLGQVDRSVVSLTYQLNIVGWQNDNIDAIGLLILSWLRHQHIDHSFTVKTILGESPCELGIDITDRHLVTADGASLAFEEDKLRVLAITLTVAAEVLTVRYGTKTTATVQAGSVL